MAIYAQVYREYAGSRRGRLSRWWAFVSGELGLVLRHRGLFWISLFVAVLFFARLTQMWLVANQSDILKFVTQMERYQHHASVSARTYLGFMTNMQFYVFLLAAVVGGSLIARDQAAGAVPLYFSRPLSRWGYISARFLQLAAALSLVSLVPGLLLYFGYSLVTSDWEHLWRDREVAGGIVVVSVIYITSAALPMLALSCVCGGGRLAGAAFAMFYLFGWMMVGFFRAVPWRGGGEIWTRFEHYCSLLSLPLNWYQISEAFFGEKYLLLDTPWTWSLYALAGLSALSFLVLWTRLRPVEVVR
ncbi:hypothetical protein HS125_01380 [bacterium]|nr:hypothetical protein [bacterium]